MSTFLYLKYTLCWKCAKYSGLCAWSRDFLPVPGWTAEPTKIKFRDRGNITECNSFRVIDCPEFVRDVEDADDF